MQLNLQPRARLGIYIVTGVGSLVMAYLYTKGVVSDPEMVLWSGLSALVNGLSAYNVKGI
jgi:hypothetical protein